MSLPASSPFSTRAKRLENLRRQRAQWNSMPNIDPINREVKNFKYWYHLKPIETKRHSSLPSLEAIEREKRIITFEEEKKSSPHKLDYKRFYKDMECLYRRELWKPQLLPCIQNKTLNFEQKSTRERSRIRTGKSRKSVR